jgi:hypothetical protein
MNMAGKLQREGRTIEVRHVAEVLAGMTQEPAIGLPAIGEPAPGAAVEPPVKAAGDRAARPPRAEPTGGRQ